MGWCWNGLEGWKWWFQLLLSTKMALDETDTIMKFLRHPTFPTLHQDSLKWLWFTGKVVHISTLGSHPQCTVVCVILWIQMNHEQNSPLLTMQEGHCNAALVWNKQACCSPRIRLHHTNIVFSCISKVEQLLHKDGHWQMFYWLSVHWELVGKQTPELASIWSKVGFVAFIMHDSTPIFCGLFRLFVFSIYVL